MLEANNCEWFLPTDETFEGSSLRFSLFTDLNAGGHSLFYMTIFLCTSLFIRAELSSGDLFHQQLGRAYKGAPPILHRNCICWEGEKPEADSGSLNKNVLGERERAEFGGCETDCEAYSALCPSSKKVDSEMVKLRFCSISFSSLWLK